MYKVKVQYRNDVDEVMLPGEQSLLSELEERNILANHNCRQGHCGLCMAVLRSGEVEHIQVLYPLSQGEILLCSAKAIADISIVIT